MEKVLKTVIEEQLSSGVVEKVMAEEFEKAVRKSVSDAFGWHGKAKEMIDAKIKDVLIPVVEDYDFNTFVPKLDIALAEIAKNSLVGDYSELVNKFTKLYEKPFEDFQKVTIEELAEKYAKYCGNEVDVSNLEIDYDCGASYENITIRVYFEELEEIRFSDFMNGVIYFECEEDENLNYSIPMTKFSVYDWRINSSGMFSSIESLTSMSEMDILVSQLVTSRCKVDVSGGGVEFNDVEVEAEPELSYS